MRKAKRAKVLRTRPQMARIFEDLFSYSALDEFKQLSAGLKIGVARSNRGELLSALDSAEDNSRRAHLLYINAVLFRDQFISENEKLRGGYYESAKADLEEERARSEGTKQITNADVEARMKVTYFDEIEELRQTILKHKLSADHAKHLVDAWKSRCRSLQVMLGSSR